MDRSRRDTRPHRADRRGTTSSRLFAVYAVMSLVPVALLGWAVNSTMRHEIDQRALRGAAARAQTIADSAVVPALGTRSIANGLSPEQRVRLEGAATSLDGVAKVLKLRVRSVTGDILFDVDHPNAGRVHDADDEVVEAAAGAPVKILTHVGDDEVDQTHGPARTGPRAVEIYVAFRQPGATKASGVLETYLPYAPFARSSATTKAQVARALVIGLLALWLVLGLVSWWVTRQLRASARANRWLARHDQLTGLPNRLWFSEQIDGWADEDRAVLVAVVDIARFREVNETIGHANGDRYLGAVAGRLDERIGHRGSVARLGGDQFGVLWPHIGAGGEREMLFAIETATRDQVEVGGIRVNVELSVGVASSSQARGPAELLRCADLACHAAKESGLTVVGYTRELDAFDPDRLALAGQLASAIADGQLRLHYQPKVDLVSGKVTSVEALVRWQHPDRGLVHPTEFIGIAETTSLIRPLTAWVIDEAVGQLRSWRSLDVPLSVSINISARNLAESDLPERVLSALAVADVDPTRLEVELTETAVVSDLNRARDVLGRLHDAGVRIALDDFGQGATALGSLTDLPVDELKIDRAFVAGLTLGDDRRAVVEFVIALGHQLGLNVVAEGIETDREATLLTSMGCNEGQGFLFCRPLPAYEFEDWLVAHQQMLDQVSERSAASAVAVPDEAATPPKLVTRQEVELTDGPLPDA